MLCDAHPHMQDYTISRCEDLPMLHRRILEGFVAARPPDGWNLGFGEIITQRGTAGWYVQVHGSYHMRGSLGSAAAAAGRPLGADLVGMVHSIVRMHDSTLNRAVVWGLGDTIETAEARLQQLIDLAEASGEYMNAASLLYAAQIGYRIRSLNADMAKQLFRAQKLLSTHLESDREANVLERWCLGGLAYGGGKLDRAMSRRLHTLQQRTLKPVAEEPDVSNVLQRFFSWVLMGWMNEMGLSGAGAEGQEQPTAPSAEELAAALSILAECITLWKVSEVSELFRVSALSSFHRPAHFFWNVLKPLRDRLHSIALCAAGLV